jgi:hypothetical protein
MGISNRPSEDYVGMGIRDNIAGWRGVGRVLELALDKRTAGGAVDEVAIPHVVAVLQGSDAPEDNFQVPEREGSWFGVEIGADVEVVVVALGLETLVFNELGFVS